MRCENKRRDRMIVGPDIDQQTLKESAVWGEGRGGGAHVGAAGGADADGAVGAAPPDVAEAAALAAVPEAIAVVELRGRAGEQPGVAAHEVVRRAALGDVCTHARVARVLSRTGQRPRGGDRVCVPGTRSCTHRLGIHSACVQATKPTCIRPQARGEPEPARCGRRCALVFQAVLGAATRNPCHHRAG